MSDDPQRLGISPGAWAKFDREMQREVLRRAAETDAEWPVMIRLEGSAAAGNKTGAKAVAHMQEQFAARADDLLKELERWKARDIKQFWINGTVSATVGLGALAQIAKREDVREILLMVKHNVAL